MLLRIALPSPRGTSFREEGVTRRHSEPTPKPADVVELFASPRISNRMSEQRTLQILAWGLGGLVGILFILNAIALAMQT